MKIGKVFYSNQKNSEWKIWHEIMNIEGNIVTLANYGKDTESHEVKFTKKGNELLFKKRNFNSCITRYENE